MKNSRLFHKSIIVFLLLEMILALYITACADNDADSIAKSRQRIVENQERLNEIKKEKAQADSKLKELRGRRSDVANYIDSLDRELGVLNAELDRITTEIETAKQLIEETEVALAKAREDEHSQYESMKLRIRYMYEKGDLSFVNSLMGSGSFAELLNQTEYIRAVSEYDRRKLDEFVRIREEITVREEELKSDSERLQAEEEAAVERKKALEELESEKQKELQSYESKISAANADVSSLAGDMSSLQAAIREEENNIAYIEEMIRRREQDERKKAEANGRIFEPLRAGDIVLSWPLPGQSRITSAFGTREQPVAGASTNHNGIDVGAPKGTKIVASAGGTVVIATYSKSAGNYIMLSHGGGVYTVYMHMSAMSVSEGDTVSRGQKIGEVGSTGYSTGPHLHFGVRIDGSYKNPLSYVSP